jgi:hypothetical protein
MTASKNKTIVNPEKLMTGEGDAAKITEFTARLMKRYTTLNVELQLAACSVIGHVAKHGNVNVMNDFIKQVEDAAVGVRVNLLREFFDKFGNVVYDEETDTFKLDRAKPVKLGEALETPWWKGKKESKYRPIDTLLDLKEYYGKATERAKKADETKGDHVTATELSILADAIDAIDAARKAPATEQAA